MNDLSNKKHWLVERAKTIPDQIALRNIQRTLTYSQLLFYSKSATHYFNTIGIKKGEHISIISNNSIEFVIIINALWLLGAVPIPLNLKLRVNEIEKLVLHSKSAALLNVDNVVDCSKMQFKNVYTITFDDFTYSHINLIEEKLNINNIALMMYSSGSTGTPKCVQITFNNLFESAKSLQTLINQGSSDVWLASLPFYHIGGFSIITRSLIFGTMLSIIKSFSIEEMIKGFVKYKPTYFSIVPTMLQKILNKKVEPWNELKNIFIGGGPINTKDITKAVEIGFPLIGVYGSTETASMVTTITKIDIFEISGCVGKPLPGNAIEIIDTQKKTLSKMKVGEIVISSKCVAKSYFNYSGDNGSKILNQKFYSNDLGYLDNDGNLFLIGRKDDMIISGGENINLNEIEKYMKSLKDVIDCTAIKVQDKKWGESYMLLIVPKVKSEKAKEKIIIEMKKNIAKFKQPKSIHFIKSLFRNELGKVDKNKHLVELHK